MPDPSERSCALHVYIPDRPRHCPDVVPLATALAGRLHEVLVVAWTDGPEPGTACVERAAAVAAQLEAAIGIWPAYAELRDGAEVLPPRSRAETTVLTVSARERRRVLRAARVLAERSGAHLALVGHVADRSLPEVHHA